MILNLHNLTLEEAKDEILWEVEESVALGDTILELIHGYHNGQVLKTYIRSHRFIEYMEKNGFSLQKEGPMRNEGVTKFKIFLKKCKRR